MDTKEFGQIIRKRRKEMKLTIADLSLYANVGIRFLSELENGKPTIEIGKALNVLSALNIKMHLTSTPVELSK